MDEKNIQELSEVIQSANLNILLGSGVSMPFLPVLGNIEQELNKAKNDSEREKLYKQYLTGVMLPNKKIIGNELSGDTNYQTTKKSYEKFFYALSEMILRRKTSILSKQINIFTTNIDVIIETVLEELQLEYNDGFSGKFNPIFNLANFKKSINQRSLHFDHISEIPVFNIVKIHGSLTWKHDGTGDKIIFSHTLDHFDKKLSDQTGADFTTDYRKILVVNPEETKHLESVLNVYYSELLRMYSSELEKENASLFVLGFSMEDKHIKEITLRAAQSNPTLRVYIFCSQKSKEAMCKKMEVIQHPNIHIYTPVSDSEKYTLDGFTENILKKVTAEKISEKNA